MPNHRTTSSNSSGIVVIVACVMFCFVVSAVVVIAIAVPEGGNPGSLIALLLGAFASTIPALATLAKVGGVEKRVEDLSNGLMDSKVRAGVADVVADHLIDPTVHARLVDDRARRDAGA